MKKLFPIAFVVVTLFFCSFIFFNISKSTYYAEDSVYLYEYGKRMHDNSVIFVTDRSYAYSKRCKNGLCSIGQQYIPVTMYKTKNDNVLTFFEFESQHPKDYYDGEILDRNMWDSENYLEYLKQNSDYSISFSPCPSEGGEGCGSPGCWGGRIGNERSYALNINNGNYNLISGEPKEYFLGNILSIKDIIYLLTPIIVLVLIIYSKRKRNKKK